MVDRETTQPDALVGRLFGAAVGGLDFVPIRIVLSEHVVPTVGYGECVGPWSVIQRSCGGEV